MTRLMPVAIALACGLAAASALAEAPFKFADTPGKLPKDVVPVAYRLDLVPDLDALRFTGQEQIDIDVAEPTDTVTLDARNLTFDHVALSGEDGAKASVTLDKAAETASFHFPHPLAAGRHTLDIAYAGPIPAEPHGLYYNDFDTAAGRRRMLVTQFESIHARAMLPSWDEPAFKATYKLSVVLPQDFAAVSNTPIEAETPNGSLKKVAFAQTPKMSSYLLVLCAGPLERIQSLAKADGVDIGLWAVPGKAQFGRDAVNAAAVIVPYYNDYFGVKFPLPKLDLIAVPGNFSAGAMENWGAITFIDNDLLFDPEHSSPSTRETVYLVTAHEIAHQWSGDLVTMGWWNDSWLNEGFATWMQYKATDRFNPSWHEWLRTRAAKEDAMALDARPTSHPIQIEIKDESQIGAAFDAISYKKGAALIRMLEAYLGEQGFREGMRKYMKEHAYSNATTADLWAALEAASGKPVAQIAAGFTEQPGIPLIKVDVACDKDEHVATLTQDRFAIGAPDLAPDAPKQSWQVPVQIGVLGGHDPRTVLVGAEPQTVRLPDCTRPVQANFGDTGYFRVQYDDAALKALSDSYQALPPANRLVLLADQWALVEAGKAEPSSWLGLTKSLGGETEYTAWKQVIASLRRIDEIEQGTPEQPAFRHYAAGLLRPVLDRVGWAVQQGEPSGTALLRNALIAALGRFDDAATIAECRKRFADIATLSPDIADAVVETVGRHADAAAWDKLHALGQAASGTEAKLRYYYALAAVRDPALLDKSVALAQTDEIANGRVNRFVIQAARESGAPDRVWTDLMAHPEPVLDKLRPASRGEFLAEVASASASPATAKALEGQKLAKADAGSRYETDRAVEEIGERAALRSRLGAPIGAWLKANGGA